MTRPALFRRRSRANCSCSRASGSTSLQPRDGSLVTRLGAGESVALVQGYIRFMRDEGRRMSRSAAPPRAREARAKEIEVRTAERLGKLVPLEDFDAFVDLVCGLFRAELGGLPARFTRDLPTRRALEREINELLTRIADVLDAKSAAIPGPCDP